MTDRTHDCDGTRMRYQKALHWALPAAPVLGFATFLLLGWGPQDDLPRPTGELSIWQVLLATQVVVWAVLAGVGLRGLGRLDSRLQQWWPEDFLACKGPRWRLRQTAVFLAPVYGALALMFVFGLVGKIQNPPLFPGQVWKILLLHVGGGAAAIPHLVGLRWVQLSAADAVGWAATARAIAHIRSLRRALRSATAAVGVIIALAVVSTGANRQAVLAAGKPALPESLTLIYGAWFTAVLAAVYLFVFSALDGRARWVLDEAVALPDPDPAPKAVEEFTARTKLRAALADELELGGDPRKNLEGLVAVFSPLLGALLTRLGGL